MGLDLDHDVPRCGLPGPRPENSGQVADTPTRRVGWTGRRVPAHCTASGRALLFDHDLDSLAEVLGADPLPAAGPRAPRTPAELHDRIVAARASGWATVDEEFEEGLVAVAAPVRGMRGHVVAAVNVSAPRFRFGGAVDRAGPAIKNVADRLSGRLGTALSDLSAST